VPPSVRRKAGHKNGEDLEFRVSGGVITILPKLPAAYDEYTPAQRRAIDAQLAEALTDIQAGRTHGPFRTLVDVACRKGVFGGPPDSLQPGFRIVHRVTRARFAKRAANPLPNSQLLPPGQKLDIRHLLVGQKDLKALALRVSITYYREERWAECLKNALKENTPEAVEGQTTNTLPGM
jgi:bifunctional DNA-binding transcriptional regulator/antitoxin component of YhaV-PrlF toxin-antitoxin module